MDVGRRRRGARSPGGKLASLRCRYAIPRRPLPTTESRICASDAGSSIGFEKRMANAIAAVVERVVPRGPRLFGDRARRDRRR